MLNSNSDEHHEVFAPRLGEQIEKRSAVPFNKPAIVGREFEYIYDAIRRGQLSGDGEYTRKCHAAIRKLTGSAAALLTHSCTAALEMAAILADLKPGDEVILPSYTFVSTANAVVLRGATPVFVDIDPASLNIDPMLVAEAVTAKTRAIFAVHYAGFPADMDALAAIAEKHDLLLVEDAAQALGSTYKGRPAGSLGDMATFSFHETKNIISGEGGALTLMRPDLVHRAEIIREKGTNRSQFMRGETAKYTWVDVGSSFLPGELIAAYLCGQLEHERGIRERRLTMFQQYWDAFENLDAAQQFELPRIPQNTSGNGHMFYLLLENREKRADFIAYLKANDVVAPFHYVPLHSSPFGRENSRTHGLMSNTDEISARLVRLPMFYTLGEDAERVIEITSRWLRGRT
ncbi:dTDP-4-amino-4,6-dideoxygalactose transaminase [Aurantiacibacter rhizosphaerae]|uniref:dTDP-4-amino-4,6-dideoxygalactose transaminase n=1 Tax=Aurantiacibacter rhizosphaerae TaxID=2691582 RepID=A0A844XHH6_9SPHN|nr:dTDP-4-amino-4,6-dideoxygalactose transaminase [Aurantiacibacter rhizosphaerae]MWV29456.1 dTDP-4-amino-4,6-dideoxygalactose transaminase [Aurantiacibacter rhizosphaerae]